MAPYINDHLTTWTALLDELSVAGGGVQCRSLGRLLAASHGPMMATLSTRSRVLLKMSFLTTFAESMLVPMYAAFTESVGGSILDAGIAFGVFSIATGIVVSLIGTRPWFQVHIKTFLALGFFISAACDTSYIFVQNRWQLFAAQVFAGLATGLIEPAWDSLFTDDIEHSSAKHWSIWAGGSHLVAGGWNHRGVLFLHLAVHIDGHHRHPGHRFGMAIGPQARPGTGAQTQLKPMTHHDPIMIPS